MKLVPRVLVVEDGQDAAGFVCRVLSEEAIQVRGVTGGGEAVSAMFDEGYDIVILGCSLDMLDTIRETDPSAVVIVALSTPDVDAAVKAMKMGAFNCVVKPVSVEYLKRIVSEALMEKATVDENLSFKKSLAGKPAEEIIVGNSEPIKNLVERIKRVAASDCNVLIAGEAGTGKESVARSIHSRSSRSKNKFVPIDCSALNEATAEEIVPALIEESASGTVYLRQFCDLPLRIQALVESMISRSAHRHNKKVVRERARIIASAIENPTQLIEAKKVYASLFYALNQFHISVPALRERADDIPVLATRFLVEARKRYQKPVEGFSIDSITALKVYGWPGNLKELRNAVHSALLNARGKFIETRDLPELLMKRIPSDSGDVVEYRNLKAFASREYVESLLKRYNGNVTRASAAAGIHRSTLQRLLRRYNIKSSTFRARSDVA